MRKFLHTQTDAKSVQIVQCLKMGNSWEILILRLFKSFPHVSGAMINYLHFSLLIARSINWKLNWIAKSLEYDQVEGFPGGNEERFWQQLMSDHLFKIVAHIFKIPWYVPAIFTLCLLKLPIIWHIEICMKCE